MFRINILALAGAVLATSLSVVAVSPAVSAQVRYADLDTATPSGRAALDARIAHAAQSVCASGERQLAYVHACRREVIATVQDQLRDISAHGPVVALR